MWSVSISYDNQYVAAVIGDTLYMFFTSSNTPLWKDTNGPGNDYASYYYIAFVKEDNVIVADGYSSNYTEWRDYHIWAKDVNNNTIWASAADYGWNLEKAVSGDGQYFAGTDSNFKVHFLGPPYTPEFTAYYMQLSIIAMVAVVLYFFKKFK